MHCVKDLVLTWLATGDRQLATAFVTINA